MEAKKTKITKVAKKKNSLYYEGVGRRKSASCRVRLHSGTSAVKVGEKTVAKTFVSSGSTADLGEIPATGISRLIARGAIAKMMVNGEEHQLTVVDIVDGKVTLELQSALQTLTMVKGDVKNVDFDADGNNDLKVTLHGFDNKERADLTLEAIAQPGEEGYVPPAAPVAEPAPTPEPTGSSSTLIIIIVLVIIVIVGYMLVRRKN